MARIHLMEWEDQAWFPKNLRSFATDFLEFLAARTKMFEPIEADLVAILKNSKEPHIVDLASGAGGALLTMAERLQAKIPDLKITFSDYYPHPEMASRLGPLKGLSYHPQPVDARQVPESLKGLRTLFLSFHHFRPEEAVKILSNAVQEGEPIAIFEGQERSLPSIMAMLFSPISLWFSTPFIRPFKWSRLLFTYLIPVLPLMVLWDGVVSSLRTYSIKELKELVALVPGGDEYDWQIGKKQSGPAKILYLIGQKKEV